MAPVPDRTVDRHIETRLLIVAEMLEQAVAEVRRAMSDVRASTQTGSVAPEPSLTIHTQAVNIQGSPQVRQVPPEQTPDDDVGSSHAQ